MVPLLSIGRGRVDDITGGEARGLTRQNGMGRQRWEQVPSHPSAGGAGPVMTDAGWELGAGLGGARTAAGKAGA
jgi:hypothetical protein